MLNRFFKALCAFFSVPSRQEPAIKVADRLQACCMTDTVAHELRHGGPHPARRE